MVIKKSPFTAVHTYGVTRDMKMSDFTAIITFLPLCWHLAVTYTIHPLSVVCRSIIQTAWF